MQGNALEKWVSEGLQGVIDRLFGLMIHSGGPLPVRGEYAGPTSPVATVDQGVLHLQNIFSPLVLFLATLGILLAAIRLLWTRRIDPMMDLIRGLLTVIVATFGGLALVYAFVNFGNGLTWMVTESVTFRHDGMQRNFLYTAREVYPSIIRVGSDLGDLGFEGNEPARQAVTLLIGLAVMIGLTTQMIVLSLLEAVVYLIACLLPLAAASTMIPGVQMFSKIIGWLFACLLYKPFLLMIYLAGLVILGTDTSATEDLPRYLMGAAVMLLATGALPVLMKLMSSPALWMMALATGGAGSLLGGGGGGGGDTGGGGGNDGSSGGGGGMSEGAGGGTQGFPSSQSAAGANERAATLSRNLGEGDGGGAQGGPPSGAADRDALGTQGSGAGDASGGPGGGPGTLGGTGGGDPTASGASDSTGSDGSGSTASGASDSTGSDGSGSTASGASDSTGSDGSGSTASGASGAVDSTVSGSEQTHTSATGATGADDGGGSAPGAVGGSSSGGGDSYGGTTSDGAIPETGGTSSTGGTGGSGENGAPEGPRGSGSAEMPDGVGGGVG
ncbi:hypothetical protein PWG71_17340 [Nocardiopsis sp. N85]|uniref:hypothetical protein n=1 Tax=Nocardiopsis sp. N85 TaxID=3029400 RepID=UPI00237F17AE|nr:hypothetical protein [Nocardiopsis sp. N85]MDE3723159.1 hypothetical protein [Nocardiopsis sp. N85]